jgi:hypothetical protein
MITFNIVVRIAAIVTILLNILEQPIYVWIITVVDYFEWRASIYKRDQSLILTYPLKIFSFLPGDIFPSFSQIVYDENGLSPVVI